MIHLTEYQNQQGEPVGFFVEACNIPDSGDDLTFICSAGMVSRDGRLVFAKSYARGFEARSKASELAYLTESSVCTRVEIETMEGV